MFFAPLRGFVTLPTDHKPVGHYFCNKIFLRGYYCIKFKTRQEVILIDLIVPIFVRLATMGTKFELEREDRFVTGTTAIAQRTPADKTILGAPV